MKRLPKAIFVSRRSRTAALAIAGVLAVSGCGSDSKTANPGSVNSTNYNSYFGTQSAANESSFILQAIYGGAWNFTRDDSSTYFNYNNIGVKNYPSYGGTIFNQQLVGAASPAGSNFLKLSLNSMDSELIRFNAGGYALEMHGSGALVRPADAHVPPALLVQANACPVIDKPTTYQFIALGSPFPDDSTVHVAYGSIDASSSPVDPIGSNQWTLANLKMYALDGTDLQPMQYANSTCAVTQAGYAVNILPSAATGNLQYTLAVGPTGLFVVDQGQGDQNLYFYENFTNINLPPATGLLGLAGVQRPASALDTGQLVAGQYLGFEVSLTEIGLGIPGSFLVSFGAQPGSGSTMTGGLFPGDDPTQTPQSNVSINLGQQDSNAGLYKSVTVTVPDTSSVCIGKPYGGTSAGGAPTCVYQGVAVAGQAGGKYVLFVTVNDLSQQARGATPLATLQFFLYQQ